MIPRTRRSPLFLALVAAGVVVRIVLIDALPVPPFSDFEEYSRTAVQIAQEGHMHKLSAMHPPGYPLILAAAIRLAPGIDDVLVSKIVNVGLGLATVLLGAALARRFAGEGAGTVAAGILSFHPRGLLMPTVLASENLFAPALFGFLLVLPRRAPAVDTAFRAVAAGLLTGVLTLTRSVAYFLPAVWLLAALCARVRPKRLVRDLVLLVLVQHAVLLPWALRNKQDVGKFTFLTVSSGMGLFNGSNENATGMWYPWLPDLERLRPGIIYRSNAEIDRVARQEAIWWIRKNPGRATGLYFRRLGIILEQDALVLDWTLGLLRDSDDPARCGPACAFFQDHEKGLRASYQIAVGLNLVVGLVGAVWLCARTRRDHALMPLTAAYLGTIAYIFLLSAVVAVNGRYRWPLEDLFVPLGAAWLYRVAHRTRLPSGNPS